VTAVEAMAALARAVGIPGDAATELCANVVTAIDYAPRRTRRDGIILRAIAHRRQHWPAVWSGIHFDQHELARAMVRAYDAADDLE